MNKPHRGTIFVEDARVTEHTTFEDEQYVLRLAAPECARRALPGSFVHIRCDEDIPMRRPLSIMSADAQTGEIEILYKIVGTGLRALSHCRAGDTVSIIGPIGNGFSPATNRPVKLMIGGGVGIPPMIFLATHLARNAPESEQLVLMGSEVPFPFAQIDSSLPVTGIDSGVVNSMSALESIGVAARLASLQNYAGCYSGYVTDLARDWLAAQEKSALSQIEVFACGPEPMLQAAATVTREFGVPCQLCLEEFMACAVGGCAGCAVPVYSEEGMAMKRVCVDGPVFTADSIYP